MVFVQSCKQRTRKTQNRIGEGFFTLNRKDFLLNFICCRIEVHSCPVSFFTFLPTKDDLETTRNKTWSQQIGNRIWDLRKMKRKQSYFVHVESTFLFYFVSEDYNCKLVVWKKVQRKEKQHQRLRSKCYFNFV